MWGPTQLLRRAIRRRARHERGDTLRVRASRLAVTAACTGHALCSAVLLRYSAVLGVLAPRGR